MEYKHRVSILIPCYNGESYIDRSFSSIINQTETSLEVIMVDDGSTDQSFSIAKRYENIFLKYGHRLVLIHKANGGAASAIKTALDKASGKYIIPLDIDDELMPESCKIQADFLDNNSDCGLVLTNGYIVYDEVKSKHMIRDDSLFQKKNNIFNGLLLGKVNNVPGMYMIRRLLLQDFYSTHIFLITKYGQNLQLLMPAAYLTNAGYITRPLLKYYKHLGSHSNPGNYDREMANLVGYKDIRLNMLHIMGIETGVNLDLVNESFLTAALFVDIKYGKRKEYNIHYNALIKYRKPNFQEKMDYYTINKSLKQYWYRGVFRLNNKLRCLSRG